MMTTQFGSEQRFNELCALLGDGIMEDVWLYSEDKPDVVLATLQALPPVVQALGVGCARYLKVNLELVLLKIQTDVARCRI